MKLVQHLRSAACARGWRPRRAWPMGVLSLTMITVGCSAGLEMATGTAAGPATTVRTLAPGVTHSFSLQSEGPWAIHVVEVDPAACGVELRVIKAMDSVIGRETTSRMAARFEAEFAPVLAAVNADFFRFEPDGVPEGPQISGGQVVVAEGTFGPSVSTRFSIEQPVFGVTRSGRTLIGETTLSGRVWTADRMFPLGRVNAAPGSDSISIFNRFANRSSEMTAGHVSARLRLIAPRGAAGDLEMGVVVAVDTVPSPLSFLESERVMVGSGEAATWLRGFEVGDTIRWHLAFAGAPGALTELVGGFPLLILDGETVLHRVPRIRAAFAEARHPRTAIGRRADGTILLVTVDGRQPEYSDGMSLVELTALLLDLGAVDALNLDGGGSTTLVVRHEVVNRPSDPEERPVANAVLVRGPRAGECR